MVTSLNHQGQELSDPPFELVTFASALFPGCAVLLDECVRSCRGLEGVHTPGLYCALTSKVPHYCLQRRTPLFYALEQQWRLEKLSWLVDKTLAAILEKDTEVLCCIWICVALAI